MLLVLKCHLSYPINVLSIFLLLFIGIYKHITQVFMGEMVTHNRLSETGSYHGMGFWKLMNSGAREGDSDEERLKKAVLSLITSGITFLAIFWGSLYVLSGYPLAGAIPLTYAVISLFSIVHFFKSKRFGFFRSSQFMMILLLPFLLTWSLGGFANSSAVLIWAFFTPLAALFFADLKSAMKWLAAFIVLTIISAFIDSSVVQFAKPMSASLNTVYFLMNMGCGFLLIYIVLHHFVRDREHSHRQSILAREEALLARKEAEQAYEQIHNNEKKILELMLTDPLTNIANRRCLNEQLQAEMDRAKRYQSELSIIMTDLDCFKQINDSYGHTVGDHVLVSYANIMKENIRSSDTVARYGGEEFIILIPEIAVEGVVTLAERIRQSLEASVIDGTSQPITASFGITKMHDGDTAETLLARADRALYVSKNQGRNQTTAID